MKLRLLLLFSFISSFCMAQVVAIPDTFFKTKLLSADATNLIAQNLGGAYFKVDQNNDGQIQVAEALQVSYLDVHDSNIISMVGIQSFTNLTYLRCEQNFLSTLDVTALTQLEVFYCCANAITSLNVSTLVNLRLLVCYSNLLQSLDVSNLTQLEDISCYSNQLTSLNLGFQNNLILLNCSDNDLSSLNVVGFSALKYLYCYNNLLNDLSFYGASSLLDFRCYNNQLTLLNLSVVPTVKYVDCSNNLLVSINLTGSTFMQSLNCQYNQLTTINATDCIFINDIYCMSNNLQSLYIKNNRNEAVYFNNNPNITLICCDATQLANSQTYTTIFPNLVVTSTCVLADVNFTTQEVNHYPNPVESVLHIDTTLKCTKIDVFDLLGRLVFSSPVHQNQIDLSALIKGNYVVKCYTAQGVFSSKICKQ